MMANYIVGHSFLARGPQQTQSRRSRVLPGYLRKSAESGVPTFREAQTGLWAQYDPEELATPQAFLCNPRLVWEWYAWRRELAAKAEPNLGHLALAQLEQQIPHFTLITQNVDGLHQRAGSQNVIELHGNIQRTICFNERQVVNAWPGSDEIPPRCPRCGGLLRPDVVWFGESLPAPARESAWVAAKQCELFLAVGHFGHRPAGGLAALGGVGTWHSYRGDQSQFYPTNPGNDLCAARPGRADPAGSGQGVGI